VSLPDFSGDILAAIRALPEVPQRAALAPDQDDLDKVLAHLSRHGDLEVSLPNDLGTVTIACSDGQRWRYTVQGICIPERRRR
jgi:ABC-type antimicrobial peptide transport system ATPase subunit